MTDVTADPGADPAELPEVRDYLDRLRAEGRHLPPDRLDEVLGDVRAHLHDAVTAGVADGLQATVAARNAVERLGPACRDRARRGRAVRRCHFVPDTVGSGLWSDGPATASRWRSSC